MLFFILCTWAQLRVNILRVDWTDWDQLYWKYKLLIFHLSVFNSEFRVRHNQALQQSARFVWSCGSVGPFANLALVFPCDRFVRSDRLISWLATCRLLYFLMGIWNRLRMSDLPSQTGPQCSLIWVCVSHSFDSDSSICLRC